MKKQIQIIKANGEKEFFDPHKLEGSLRRAGAIQKNISEIILEIESNLKDNMTTSEIYRQAFKLLSEREEVTATKYSTRSAVMDLGPSGFPFEDFIGAMFRELGYETKIRNNIQGLCIQHEVDFIAKNDEKFLMGEIKFHNRKGLKSDLKVVLYVKERFDDIVKGEFYRNIDRDLKKENWLITNTKFTTKATEYIECSRTINLMSWNYPIKGNLHDLIIQADLYPLTTLKSLSNNDKKMFLSKNIVLCRELLRGGDRIFNLVGISEEKRKGVLKEIEKLINS